MVGTVRHELGKNTVIISCAVILRVPTVPFCTSITVVCVGAVGDRLAAERMALATDPLVRLQMAGINPEVRTVVP